MPDADDPEGRLGVSVAQEGPEAAFRHAPAPTSWLHCTVFRPVRAVFWIWCQVSWRRIMRMWRRQCDPVLESENGAARGALPVTPSGGASRPPFPDSRT